MEGTQNMTPSGNCRRPMLMSMGHQWRALSTQGTFGKDTWAGSLSKSCTR